uniref:Uncharacterized protein n=1 Tax=Octopus bimaculoides TaxID=37653 RepID=A0A0L8IDB8_OCTBM
MAEIKINSMAFNVESFTYLRSSITLSNILDEISNHIIRESASYTQLHKRVWKESHLNPETKPDSKHRCTADTGSMDVSSECRTTAICGELTEGHRPSVRAKLRYKDTLKKSIRKCDIDEKRWDMDIMTVNEGK